MNDEVPASVDWMCFGPVAGGMGQDRPEGSAATRDDGPRWGWEPPALLGAAANRSKTWTKPRTCPTPTVALEGSPTRLEQWNGGAQADEGVVGGSASFGGGWDGVLAEASDSTSLGRVSR